MIFKNIIMDDYPGEESKKNKNLQSSTIGF